jgi:single-strand DNA-binding protein
MSRGLNKIMVIGHLGRDPEMRYTPAGKPAASFSLAVNRSWSDKEGIRRSHRPSGSIW